MPVPELMTWVPGQRRWCKQYAGRRYYISARKLGCPETKEGSILAANQWWRDKQAELDYDLRANAYRPAPMDDLAAAQVGVPAELFADVRCLVEQALLREEEGRKHNQPSKMALPGIPNTDDAAPHPDDLEITGPEDAEAIRRSEVMALLEKLLFGDGGKLTLSVAEQLSPDRVQQVERAAKEIRGETTTPQTRTVGALAKHWHDGRTDQAKKGKLSVARVSNTRSLLGYFVAFLGEESPVSSIDEDSLRRFYYYCLSRTADQHEEEGGWTDHTAKEVFGIARTWIRWIAENRKDFLAPRNLESKEFKFDTTPPAVQTWTVEEVQRVVGAAKGKLKLSLLLALNCGMLQGDVSDLLDKEVNWKLGTITRKRSKTKRKESVPTVTYRLWPLTFQLLQEHRSGSDRVLLTKSGLPFVRKEVVEGKSKRADSFRSLFLALGRPLDFKKPLKQLRKTSASLLESHPTYGRLTSLFLGHAPASMKEKHYAAVPQDLFDEAVAWLAKQYGFVEGA